MTKKSQQQPVAERNTNIANVTAPNMVHATVRIKGTSPLVQNRFANKAGMMLDMATPKAQKKSKSARPPRDYDRDFKNAQHLTEDGKHGIPCAAFRAAMIAACRTVGIEMTKAKMCVFVQPDGFNQEGKGLVLIKSKSPPERSEEYVTVSNSKPDIRIRPMWRDWTCDVRVEFDADMISFESVVNLLDRAGRQVGVQEGRPFSKNSVGQGWGTFTVVN